MRDTEPGHNSILNKNEDIPTGWLVGRFHFSKSKTLIKLQMSSFEQKKGVVVGLVA